MCPILDRGEHNTFACCSTKQLDSLERSLALSKVVLIRCPSCTENFAHLHCITTCSPNQSQTVKVTKVVNATIPHQNKQAVVGYQAFVKASFADGAFQSCKNVRIPATGGFAVGTMCGRYGAKLCTAQRWYDFQGDSSNGLAPLDIDFRLLKDGDTTELPEGVVPYSGTALKCNETTPSGGEVCSCQDCQESCPIVPPPQPPAGPFEVFGIDGFLIVSLILLVLLIIAFLCFAVKQKTKVKRKDQKSNEGIQQVIHPSEVTYADRNSLAAQNFLSLLFERWGTLIASYPLTVSVTSTESNSHCLESKTPWNG